MNPEPSVSVQEGIDLNAKAGETVVLNISTSDPDGDEVEVSFWQYGEADTYGLLFLQVWGGTNTIASALRNIEEDIRKPITGKRLFLRLQFT